MEAADLRPGVLVKVPQGADPAQAATAYLLHVRSVEVWASGVAHLVGEVRRLGGRPSTRRGKFRTLTVHPRRLEAAVVKPADLPPAPFGIAWVLRDAGFTVSTELPQRALRRRCRPGSPVAEAADPSKRDREVATWHGLGGSARRDAGELARYAAAIAAAGWHVTTAGHEVTVTVGRADPWE